MRLKFWKLLLALPCVLAADDTTEDNTPDVTPEEVQVQLNAAEDQFNKEDLKYGRH